MDDLVLALALVIMAALITNHGSNADCTEGDVVLKDGESKMVGCYKYICSGSQLTKKDYRFLICGVSEELCCDHGSTTVTTVKNGCTCQHEECKEGWIAKFKSWWSSTSTSTGC